MRQISVAIVGAGAAGLACAQQLRRAGLQVHVYDKARGCGGRLCTRRVDALTFDHGAPALEGPRSQLPQAIANHVHAWTPRRARLHGARFIAQPMEKPLWVAKPKMSSLGRALATGLDVRLRSRVTALERVGTGWALQDEQSDSLGRFDWVVLACPGPQAAALLPSDSPLQENAGATRYSPAGMVMLELHRTLGIDYDWVEADRSPLLRAVRESSKPGRHVHGGEGERVGHERWVLRSSAAWAQDLLDHPRSPAFDELLGAWLEHFPGASVESVHTHLWRYAEAQTPSHARPLADPTAALALCGDGYRQPGLRGAWACGLECSASILAAIS